MKMERNYKKDYLLFFALPLNLILILNFIIFWFFFPITSSNSTISNLKLFMLLGQVVLGILWTGGFYFIVILNKSKVKISDLHYKISKYSNLVMSISVGFFFTILDYFLMRYF